MTSLGSLKISGFKAYDLRGRIPDELNTDVAYRVGRAYAAWLGAKRIVVGRDIRLSSAVGTKDWISTFPIRWGAC